MADIKYLDWAGLSKYDELIKSHIAAGDKAVDDKVVALGTRVSVLESGETVEGSVAYQIAQIVNENNNGSIDTLNEIAAWIVNDTTGAAKMQADIAANAKAIKDLVGEDGTVAEQIEAALEDLTTTTAVANTAPNAGSADTTQVKVSVSQTNGLVSTVKVEAPEFVTAATYKTDVTDKLLGGETVEGSVAKAKADALAAVKALEEGAVADNADAIADLQAVTGLESLTAGAKSLNERLSTVEGYFAEGEGSVADQIADAVEEAEKYTDDLLGTGFEASSGKTVADQLSAVKTTADGAVQKTDTLDVTSTGGGDIEVKLGGTYAVPTLTFTDAWSEIPLTGDNSIASLFA